MKQNITEDSLIILIKTLNNNLQTSLN